jgi:uncharacterized protein (DUF2267 family)
MSPIGTDPFNHAVNTANIWLADIGDALGTRDRHVTHRALRAWLHCLRDRLTVNAAAKFGAQLPELVRGIYYEGWEPNRVPIKYGFEGYIQRFATEAGVPAVQVPTTAVAIADVLAGHMSPGQLEETFAALPAELRTMISGESTARPAPSGPASTQAQDRLTRLEDQIGNLTQAVRTLAHGLEDGHLTGIEAANVSRAARLADEILIGATTRSAP